jgi:uncharacterized protein YdhG (YjbR/CyaY superfamily)
MSVMDEYLAGVAPDQRAVLERIRAVVAEAVPDAEEGRSYGMPAFRYEGRPLIGFTAHKAHLSLHPFSAEVVDAVRGELEGYDLSKGTVRFTPEKPVPDEVVRQMVALRRQELTG